MKNMQWILFAIAITLVVACGGGGGKSSGPDLDDAKTDFSSGNYADALTTYLSLVDKEGASAQVGAGWCYNRLGTYSSAITQFAAAAGDSNVDGYAGWGLALWATDASASTAQSVIDKANFVIRKNPAFTLSLDSRIDVDHIVYIKACSHLLLQQYQSCVDAIKMLPNQSGYSVNVSDPNIHSLLLAKLESLGSAA